MACIFKTKRVDRLTLGACPNHPENGTKEGPQRKEKKSLRYIFQVENAHRR
jgi:hypothetical protein